MMVDGARGWLRSLLIPARCPLCAGPASPGAACAGCITCLPWNRVACPHCAEPLADAEPYLCARCAADPPGYDRAWSAFRYKAPIDRAVQALKYSADFRQAAFLGSQLAQALAARTEPPPALLIPMPLHPARLRRRGYNQALLLAQAVGRSLKIEVATKVAARTRATEDQIGKSAAERRRNVRGAFAVNTDLAQRSVAIIDDVMTTGATAESLARACRKAGAQRIEIWTVARAIHR
jgi:ComF family protein